MEKINLNFELNEQQKVARAMLIQSVLKDPKVIGFMKVHGVDEAFVSRHVQRFADWSQEKGRCDNCPGLHACRQKETGYFLDLEFEDILQNVYKTCDFMNAKNELFSHEKQYLVKDCGQEMLLADFYKILRKGDLSPKSADTVEQISEWLENPTSKGFFIFGKNGVGKTYLAVSVLNKLSKNRETVALIHVPSLSIKVKQNFDNPEITEILLALIKRAKTVVFDDIGAESQSSWFRDEILLPLLNYRMEHKKSTWFTSNLDIDGLRSHFRRGSQDNEEIIKADRILERIEYLSIPTWLDGKNRRNT